MNWHLTTIQETLKVIGSQLPGLSQEQADERLEKHGSNVLPQKKKRSIWQIFFRQFKDVMILILIVAAVVSGMVGDINDTLVILLIVLLNAIVGFVQEYRAEKAMEALKKMTTTFAHVKRAGKDHIIPVESIVPGDIVVLEAGNIIPADLRLIETRTLRVDESSLTGESQPVEKITEQLLEDNGSIGDRLNMAFKGTVVAYGNGVGVTTATGRFTELGKIAEMLQEEESTSPLQKRLSEFGKKLSFVVLAICLLLYGIGLLRGEHPIQLLLTALSLAVAAIPEALPALTTMALAFGARRMVRQNALIRRLAAVETLGSVTYICTDKTGTLTQNKMAVTSTLVYDSAHDGSLPVTQQHALHLCMLLNHDVKRHEDDFSGDSTEVALLRFALKEQTLPANVAELYPRVQELPFDSIRKCMTTIHRVDDYYLVLTKGALESILERCKPGEAHSLALQKNDEMASNGLRVLAFAAKVLPVLPETIDGASIETDLNFIGVAGLMDPPREEVKQSIQDCQNAGIAVVMITGDHPLTAKTIASQIGLLQNDQQMIITGAELARMPEEEFELRVERIRVYARVSPEQKLQIVKKLQHKKHFVAMTGDGVNDAPALKRANIGIAMGITGTDVSKEVAHMILLDDNFSTIVKAVREGRKIFDNIRKFIRYIMTGNAGEIWTIILAPLAGLPIPLLPVHILWVNLVTDGLPGLALAAEHSEIDSMRRAPRDPEESIFAHGLGVHVLWVGLLIGGTCLAVQTWAISNGIENWQTMVFTVLCLGQMGHVLAIRSESRSLFRQGLFSNLPMLGAIGFTFALQMAVIYWTPASAILKLQPLTLEELFVCMIASLIPFIGVEVEKHFKRRKQSNKLIPKPS